MSTEKHERLERLKELLNFSDGGHWDQYCNGYRQAEMDSELALTNLDQKLGIELASERKRAEAAKRLAGRYRAALEKVAEKVEGATVITAKIGALELVDNETLQLLVSIRKVAREALAKDGAEENHGKE